MNILSIDLIKFEKLMKRLIESKRKELNDDMSSLTVRLKIMGYIDGLEDAVKAMQFTKVELCIKEDKVDGQS